MIIKPVAICKTLVIQFSFLSCIFAICYYLDSIAILHLFIFVFQFSSVQWLSPVRVFVTPQTAACQASLSVTNSRSLLKLMSIDSVTVVIKFQESRKSEFLFYFLSQVYIKLLGKEKDLDKYLLSSLDIPISGHLSMFLGPFSFSLISNH